MDCGADDPELEELQRPSPTGHVNTPSTPLAAWVLVTLLLLSFIQKNSTDNIIGEMSQLYAMASLHGNRRNKPYSKRMMIFCMTLAGYSARAYGYFRSVVKNCVPSPVTLRNYRKRVDGSPGFSSAALNMIKHKVNEMHEKSRKLFVSLSSDDMSIRYRYCV